MILKRDVSWKYGRQLTLFEPSVKDLEFALSQFRGKKDVHCVVRKNKYNCYAVFVEPQVIDEDDRQLLFEERTVLEDEHEVEVVDIEEE